MARDILRGFGALKKKGQEKPAPKQYGEANFEATLAAFFKAEHQRDPKTGELEALTAQLKVEDKEKLGRQLTGNAQEYRKILGGAYRATVHVEDAEFEEIPVVVQPKPQAWTNAENVINLRSAVREHENRRTGGSTILNRVRELGEQLAKTKKEAERERLNAELQLLISSNINALQNELSGLEGAAQIAAFGERLAAREVAKDERVALFRRIVEFADAAKKEQRLSDQEVIRVIAAKIERGLAEKGEGRISEFDADSMRNLPNELGLLTTNTAVLGVELMTLGAYLSLIAQAALKTTIVYTSPAGIAFNVACVAAAAGVLPLTELAKELNFHEKAARAAFYDELAKEGEGEKDVKKIPGKMPLKALVGSAIAAAGAGVGTIALNYVPKAATVVAAQGPNMLSTAAALRQGHEAGNFVEDTNAALAQAGDQVERILRAPRAEGYQRGAPLPSLIASYQHQLEDFGDVMIRNELGGGKSEASGGTGVEGVGPSALRKMWLFEGWYPGNYVSPDDPRVIRLGPAASEWAREQRAGFSYEMTGADGTTERIPIEFLTRTDGSQESVPDWVERRYMEFETQAQDLLVSFAEQRTDLGELSVYLADRLVPVNVKFDLMLARIQSTEGFSQDTDDIEETLLQIEELFRNEFTIPVQGLNESLITSLRQVGAGDEGMRLDAPELRMELDLLQNLEPPHSLSLGELMNPAQISKLFMERNLSGQLLFALLFGGIGFAGLWKYNAGKGRARKHARIMRPKLKKMFGERYREGEEYNIAREVSGGVGETLKEFLVGNGAPFNMEGLRSLIPFETNGSWLQLQPEFVLFSMRRAGERSGKTPTRVSKNPLTWIQAVASAYAKGMASFTHGATMVPEVKMYARLEARYRDRTGLTQEVFGEMLPGFTDLAFIGRRITRLYGAGLGPEDKQVQELAIQFKNAYAEMVFSHLIARTRYAKTKIDYYNKAYDDLKENGEFGDLGVERIRNLPNLNIDFGGSTVELGDDDKAKLEMVRKTGLRTMAIAEIERGLAEERQSLSIIEKFIEELEEKESVRSAEFTTSFVSRLEELKQEVGRTSAVQTSGDRLLGEMSPRGSINRIVREQLQEEISSQLREHRSEQNQEKFGREYGIQEQYAAVNEMLQFTVHDTAGGENSLFVDDKTLNRFACAPSLVLRPQGHGGAIAEYYALSFRVTEVGKTDPVYEDELPIQTLFAKELSPSQAATEVHRWILGKRNEASIAAKLYALRGSISKNKEDVAIPEAIPLTGNDSDRRLDELFDKDIPKLRIQEDLQEVEAALHSIGELGEALKDTRMARRPKTRKEKERIKRLRARKKESYIELFGEMRREERRLAFLERERSNLKSAFPEEKRRVKTLIAFLQDPSHRAFLQDAKVSFEYLPDVATRYDNIRIIDRRFVSLGRSKAEKNKELNLDEVLNALQDPAHRNDSDRKKALLKLFTERRSQQNLGRDDRTSERLAA